MHQNFNNKTRLKLLGLNSRIGAKGVSAGAVPTRPCQALVDVLGASPAREALGAAAAVGRRAADAAALVAARLRRAVVHGLAAAAAEP